LSAIAEDDADADTSWSGSRRVLGPTRVVGATAWSRRGGGGGTPEGRQKQEARSDGHNGGGGVRHVVGWEGERVGKHRVATSAEGYVAGWWERVAEAHVMGE